ncbi:hypothetical protein IMZ48_46935 [Candidatus Bathyarchaeota archaeon]|nr:hypothetical protein [Candidatus Bathyarchaeota archaeon]
MTPKPPAELSVVSNTYHETELGHGIHDLLARTRYARFHGYEVCLEYGEAIGTMLENWCWIKDEIKAMSCHYTRVDTRYREAWQEANPGRDLPPERIPDELLEKRFKDRAPNRIHMMMHQL